MENKPGSEVKIMDGGIGTVLLSRGIPAHACFEQLNLIRPSLILEIHKNYLDAGAEAIVTNTFGGNRVRLESKLKEGNASLLEKINRAGVRLAKKAAGRRLVFASIGPLGPDARKMTARHRTRHFREQVRSLEKEKPSGYLIETMTSLEEAESAVRGVREISDRPLIALMTFPGGPRGFARTAEAIGKALRAAGADVIGTNCGRGPEESYGILRAFSRIDPGPFCARPAAGLPGSLVSPKAFAEWGEKFKKLGCSWLGGCCGTTPDYIRALKISLTVRIM